MGAALTTAVIGAPQQGQFVNGTLSYATSTSSTSRRQYLSLVYPTANLGDDKNIDWLSSSLDVLYGEAPSMADLEPTQRQYCSMESTGSNGYSAAAKLRAGPGLYSKYVAVGGVAQRHDFHASWTDNRYIEVSHSSMGGKFFLNLNSLCGSEAAFSAKECKYAPSLAAAHAVASARPSAAFADPGPGGMWYVAERGTGIYYDTGRSLTVPTKNEAMAQMTTELTQLPETRAKVCRLLQKRFPFTMPSDRPIRKLCGELGPLADLAAGLHRTAEGTKRCNEAGVLECSDEDGSDGYDLNDAWDVPMIWIARALKYDTLFFYAEFKSSVFKLSGTIREKEMCGFSELVDLRLPLPITPDHKDVIDHYLDVAFNPDPQESLWMHDCYALKPEKLASDVIAMAAGVLSVRDPLHLNNADSSRPCEIVQGEMLTCKGHVSDSNLNKDMGWPTMLAPHFVAAKEDRAESADSEVRQSAHVAHKNRFVESAALTPPSADGE